MPKIQEAREMYPAVLLVVKFGSANLKWQVCFFVLPCVVGGVAICVFCILCWLLLCASC